MYLPTSQSLPASSFSPSSSHFSPTTSLSSTPIPTPSSSISVTPKGGETPSDIPSKPLQSDSELLIPLTSSTVTASFGPQRSNRSSSGSTVSVVVSTVIAVLLAAGLVLYHFRSSIQRYIF
eukprot:TRINITY_DN5452_c1_g1_i2.p1 TRINITY_DN5452_c1_g1~~TRINITY_DN5452_c1_g1_i2.p1  ORF type:complete len:121 (-),score=17.58 TRINITY_DN5452_c1_g1_i2:61-423(-)